MPEIGPAVFVWTPEFAVGVALIDNEHRELFRVAGSLYSAMLAGQANSLLSQRLDELVRYTDTHFAHEEDLMRQHAYPELAAHQREHAVLRRRVHELTERRERGEAFLSIETMEFVWSWLKVHTTTRDRQIGRFLAAA